MLLWLVVFYTPGFYRATATGVSRSVVSDSLWPHELQPTSSVHEILQARILEWVVTPFSRGVFLTKDWTWVSCITGRFFTTEPPAKPHGVKKQLSIFLWPSCSSVPLTTTQDQLCHGGMSLLVWILCWLNGRKSLASSRNTSTQSYCLGPLEFQWLYALVVGGRVIPAYVQPNRGLLQETCSEGRDRLFWRGWHGS